MLNGSACGIDLEHFNPAKWKKARERIRNELNIPQEATVIGTVARLTGDKGINELVKAFRQVTEEDAETYLLMIGTQEEKDRLLPDVDDTIKTHPRIRVTGWQKDAAPYYTAMDIFCLPTYREGFGKVNLEAQAMRLPVVSTDTLGPRESVKNGETGFLVEPRSSKALVPPLTKLVRDRDLRVKMGRKGRQRIIKMFNKKDVINAVIEHRKAILKTECATRQTCSKHK
jgi:glycosyltransferase involved in cell wall biosynthesis